MTPDGIRSEWAAEAEIDFGRGMSAEDIALRNLGIYRDMLARDEAALAAALDAGALDVRSLRRSVATDRMGVAEWEAAMASRKEIAA